MPHWLNGKIILNKEKITYLLQHPETITSESKVALESILVDFPFFQPARALYLKVLKDENNYQYNPELKKTAAYTTDRSVLFDFITSEVFNESSLFEPEENEQHELVKAEAILNPNLFERKPEKTAQEKAVEELLEINKPLPFTKNDTHSFSEWLKLTQAKPIDRTEKVKTGVSTSKADSRKEEKFKLIDKFIQENPKIKPKESVSSEDFSKPYAQPKEHLMTETLAKVYLQQNNYKKAIQAYKILILKNPEKSGFFADQIRAIEKLQQKNK
ncbi:hypothetical protein [Planktosalinus lacus]|uniref:Tetratricopeptide repeat protein n=1 Tax=Planktosalinus lacus TaxID=1526573 RepID=A0A8J2V816_9FLAO|nr:hypothetical protein [Planktosalinus lacus]GGD86183.1 hypothetical protein GCM10011312_07790 [Planktosalinus lacus]